MTLDTILRGANLPDGRKGVDIAIEGGRIAAVEPQIEAKARDEKDVSGCLVTPPFVDAHFHMDSTLTFGFPGVNASGTLLEGIGLWGKLKPHLTFESIRERALSYCDWAVAQGLLAIRSHVDICDERLVAVEALLSVKREVSPYLELQLVAFPQDGFFRSAGAQVNLRRALDLGVEVVGGIPHFETTKAEGGKSVIALCEIAAERGLLVDMHCDENDDPLSRHVETLAFETKRLGLEGRVTGSHLTSMHSMDNTYVSKLIPLMAEARLNVVANPLINVTLQGRHDSYPKRRGMTRVPELMEAGLNVAFGSDCVMDPWYALGMADMLQPAHMGLHLAQMTGVNEMRQAFRAVTEIPAKILQLEGYGIEVGCKADLVVLQASDPVEALRVGATRLFVYKNGEVIAQTAPRQAKLHLEGRPESVDFLGPWSGKVPEGR